MQTHNKLKSILPPNVGRNLVPLNEPATQTKVTQEDIKDLADSKSASKTSYNILSMQAFEG